MDNGWDDIIEIMNAVVSTLMFVTFFIYTYFDELNPTSDVKIPEWLTLVEIILIFYIVLDWTFQLFLSD